MKLLRNILAYVFAGGNIGTILLLWICCVSTYFSPAEHPFFGILGLAFPVFLVFNTFFFIFWLVFNIRRCWIPLLGFVCIASFIQDYCPIHRNESLPENTLKVISYNVGHTVTDEDRQHIVQFLKEENADLVCLQEMSYNLPARQDCKGMIDSLHYHVVQNQGECILTRFDLVGDTLPVHYSGKAGHTLACLTEYNGDTILIINNHLESNKLTPEDKSEYKDMIKDPKKEKIKSGSRMMINRLTSAAKLRGEQTDSLCAFVERHKDQNIILCGDLNDTPISYTYQRILKRLSNTFRDNGIGVGISYNEKAFFVRIDHIFVSEDWKSHKTHVENNIKASDHYPIITYLSKKEN